MGKKKKIGVRIDDELWERFKNWVEKEHGRTRGVTADEVENALRNHLAADNPRDPLARIENDVATIKASLAEQDGGEVVPQDDPAPTPSASDTHTHTDDAVDPEVEDEFDRLQAGHPSNQDDERNDSDTQADDGDDSDTLSKPGSKATKQAKAEYVFNDLESDGAVLAPRALFETKVDKTWGFGDRATSDIIDRIFDRYHAEAVSFDGSNWQVALGTSEQTRDDRIVELVDGTEGATEEDLSVVPEGKFDGFDRDGTPTGVR